MSVPRTYGCESARRRSFSINGLTLSGLEWGAPDRPPFLCLHGGAAHAHWFDAVGPALADRYHVIALDQRGHGESDWAPASPEGKGYATADFVGDLVALMDALGWRRATVCGHSMGGHNAMALSAWHPDRVAALIVVDSRPALPPERLDQMHRRGRRGPWRHETLEAALKSFRLLPRETVAAPELLEHLARAGIAERAGRFLYRFDPATNGSRRPADVWPLLERIAAPTLVVRAEHSPVLPPPMLEEMTRRLRQVSVEVISGAYHHLLLDQPEAFTAALARFLARQPA